MNRRQFITASAAGTLISGAAAQQSTRSRFIKSICSVIFPNDMPEAEKFRQAKNAGFEGIEVRFGDEISPSLSADEVKRIGAAAHEAGIQIATMWISGAFN